MFRRILAGLVASVTLLAPVAVAAPAQAVHPSSSSSVLTPPPLPKFKGASPKGVVAIKGKPTKAGMSRSSALSGPPYYFYGTAFQQLAAGESATSLAANLHIENSFLDTGNDAHSLGEIAVQSHNGQNAVEIGTTVDPIVCGAGNSPCLFVFWWKNGVPQCYNGCGLVPYAPTCSIAANFCAGESIAAHVGLQKRFQISYSGGNWWFAYDGKWIATYPHSQWTAATPSGPGVTFDKGGIFQGFYEVATKPVGSDDKPCSDMGNGLDVSSGTASRVGSISMTGTLPGPITNNFTAWTTPVTSPLVYDTVQSSATTIKAAGKGFNAAGTAVGVTGAC